MSSISPGQDEGDIWEEPPRTDVHPEGSDEGKENETAPARGLSDEVIDGETEDAADDPKKPE
ncbi:MAG: hypothetical protein JO077_13500 [Verrucomicrobia bacterium]|nr:hypothetical protein [Verrucomicrobiota bacterium]